jgi:hypothetical protein
MFDALSFAETDAQHMELLPARTTMQVAFAQPAGGGGGGNGLGANPNCPIPTDMTVDVIDQDGPQQCDASGVLNNGVSLRNGLG